MAATGQITVNSTGFTPVQVMSQSGCKTVRILEDPGVSGWPTTDLLIAKPTSSATPVRIPSGQSYSFTALAAHSNQPGTNFPYGGIVGYVKTVSGSTTVDQDEDT